MTNIVEFKENIKNSINWGNVNDLVSGILTDKNLKKIKIILMKLKK